MKNPSSFSFLKPRQKVRFKVVRICKGFSDSNYTCIHGGGNYCGKYREIQQQVQKKKQQETLLNSA